MSISNGTLSDLYHEIERLTPQEHNALLRVLTKKKVSRNVSTIYQERLTFGQRVADRVASFGGSWTFIGFFIFILVAWVILNTLILANRHHQFDPYPFILLNLFLSMLAAIQAPIIMMSQNRRAEHDRIEAEHDYQVNLKSEMEIASLHTKVDQLRHEVLDLIRSLVEIEESRQPTPKKSKRKKKKKKKKN